LSGEKYRVEIKTLKKPMKVNPDFLNDVKGISPKLLGRMKKEAVECPVKKATIPFLECFICSNFITRVRGLVYCKGEPF
jgi:hypothetical protein